MTSLENRKRGTGEREREHDLENNREMDWEGVGLESGPPARGRGLTTRAGEESSSTPWRAQTERVEQRPYDCLLSCLPFSPAQHGD